MTGDPVLQFLARGVAALSRGDTGPLPDPPNPPANGKRLVALAAHHGLAGWVERWLPEDHPDRTAVGAVASLAAVRSMETCGALLDLAQALDAADIPFLQFKGPSTAIRYHGDIRLRPFMDLDVLVPPQSMDEACRAAEAAGFHLDPAYDTEHQPRLQPKHLSHIRGAVRLEIHRRLADFPGLDAPAEQFLADRTCFEVSGRKIPALNPTHALWHAATHGTGHAFLALKWLADLALMSRDTRALESGLEMASRTGMAASFLCGMAMLADLGVELPDAVRRPLDHRYRQLRGLVARSWQALEVPHTGLALTAHRLRMLPPTLRLRRVAQLGFTPNARDWTAVPWLHPDTPIVFSVIRPVRLMWRTFQELSKQRGARP
ncbi:MAG: nucleotidyltransferase family protein [Rhodothermales bacterium]|nr:nucleotidyltransferase family protein [Rhodothermales bacterium]MBO6779410.1 nucleotidyltransferase family protein [Rhodothermales bacterium]